MPNPPDDKKSITVTAKPESDTRRQYLKVLAVDPTTGKNIDVMLCHRKLMTVAARSVGQMQEARDIVPFTLQFPTAIYEGLCWDDDEPMGRGVGWRCYVTVPEFAYRKDGSKADAYQGEVFLVFMNADRVAYHWYWTKCDADNPEIPVGMTGAKPRFKKRLL